MNVDKDLLNSDEFDRIYDTVWYNLIALRLKEKILHFTIEIIKCEMYEGTVYSVQDSVWNCITSILSSF